MKTQRLKQAFYGFLLGAALTAAPAAACRADVLYEAPLTDTEWAGSSDSILYEAPLTDAGIAPALTGETALGAGSGVTDGSSGEAPLASLYASATDNTRSSTAAYSGAFGDQLSGFARELYQDRVEYYGVGHSTGALKKSYSKTSAPAALTFEAECVTDSAGRQTYDQSDPDAQSALRELIFAMQSATDAFKHDYPQVFWMRSPKTFTYAFSTERWASGKTASFHLSQIIYSPVESYPGANGDISAFFSSVKSAASQIRSGADKDGDGNGVTTAEEIVAEANKYLCDRLSYDYAGLARAEQITALEASKQRKVAVDYSFRIYSAAAAFIDTVPAQVVCEGYAKAMKVICDQLNIPCALVCGKATSGEFHMWNAVRINGVWYLVDSTWNDLQSSNKELYLFVTDKGTRRTASRNFSYSTNTTLFNYPVISGTCLKGHHAYSGNTCMFCGTLKGQEPSASTGTDGTKIDIHEAQVASIAIQYYTGKAKKPALKLTYNGQELEAGTDYTISYSNNVKPGTARITVQGIGAYSGTRKFTFRIRLQKPAVRGLASRKGAATFRFKKVKGAKYYQVQYSYSKDFSGAKAVRVSGRYFLNVKNLKKGRRIYFRVRAVYGSEQGEWSNIWTCTVKS